MKGHPVSSIPFYASVLLERFAYYGLRSLFVVFLIDEISNCSKYNALNIYALGTSVMALSYLLGGLLGMLGKPKIMALVGTGLQFVGALCIAFSQVKEPVFVGFIIISIGTGVGRPNAVAFLGQLFNRSKLLDSAMMIHYLMINLGAMIGTTIMVVVSVKYGYQQGFLLCALAFAGSFVAFYLSSVDATKKVEKRKQPNAYIPIVIVLSIIGASIFWLSFGYISGNLSSSHEFFNNAAIRELIFEESWTINSLVIIMLTIGLAVYFSFFKVATTLQIGIGFGCAALSMLFLFQVDFDNPINSSLSSILIGFYILQTIAEVFLGPPINSYVVRKINIMFSPLILAGFYFISMLISKIPLNWDVEYFPLTLKIFMRIMLIGAGIFFTLFIIDRRNTNYQNSQLVDDI